MAGRILLVDDSALMRSVLGDIINRDPRFHVEDKAKDGVEALDMLRKKQYDAVVLDINMPRMDGLQLLDKIKEEKIRTRVMISSTDTTDGSRTAIEALDRGAIDFVHKPERASECRSEDFGKEFLNTLAGVCQGRDSGDPVMSRMDALRNVRKIAEGLGVKPPKASGNKVIAIASSTGGPRALQSVIPRFPKDISAPIVLVQHMPTGFTSSLAERLNSMSQVTVKEAREGDILENGTVYIAKGGMHMYVRYQNGRHYIHYKDGPTRENVKPCANYMYESLMDSRFDEIVCVVLTGMGADAMEGISNLKKRKRVYVISQNADTCIVYGMPKAVESAGLSNDVKPLEDIAQDVVMNVGVSN
ncbi:MAG: chemotaxis-specific protein-glutamate methyltransferase CheB [Lachnospiraceae bacterium]|nr:chemotaxis-specific protein-glutamate methyltransferase CheB [Lachnospiraceae bacterium]